MRGWLALVPVVFGVALHCGQNDDTTDACQLPVRAEFMGGGALATDLTALGPNGEPLPAVLLNHFVVSFESQEFLAKLELDLAGATLSIEAPDGPALLTAKVYDRLTQQTGFQITATDCHPPNQLVMSTTIEVLAARGTLDPTKRTMDGDFWRRFAVDVDLPTVGCTVGSIKGRVILDVTPENVVFPCASQPYAIVGDAEAPPADAATD